MHSPPQYWTTSCTVQSIRIHQVKSFTNQTSWSHFMHAFITWSMQAGEYRLRWWWRESFLTLAASSVKHRFKHTFQVHLLIQAYIQMIWGRHYWESYKVTSRVPTQGCDQVPRKWFWDPGTEREPNQSSRDLAQRCGMMMIKQSICTPNIRTHRHRSVHVRFMSGQSLVWVSRSLNGYDLMRQKTSKGRRRGRRMGKGLHQSNGCPFWSINWYRWMNIHITFRNGMGNIDKDENIRKWGTK